MASHRKRKRLSQLRDHHTMITGNRIRLQHYYSTRAQTHLHTCSATDSTAISNRRMPYATPEVTHPPTKRTPSSIVTIHITCQHQNSQSSARHVLQPLTRTLLPASHCCAAPTANGVNSTVRSDPDKCTRIQDKVHRLRSPGPPERRRHTHQHAGERTAQSIPQLRDHHTMITGNRMYF